MYFSLFIYLLGLNKQYNMFICELYDAGRHSLLPLDWVSLSTCFQSLCKDRLTHQTINSYLTDIGVVSYLYTFRILYPVLFSLFADLFSKSFPLVARCFLNLHCVFLICSALSAQGHCGNAWKTNTYFSSITICSTLLHSSLWKYCTRLMYLFLLYTEDIWV